MKKIRVLYIEDDDRQRREFTGLLRARAFVVTPAVSGKTGLSLLAKRRVDVILCDLNMPDLSGLEVLKRAQKNHPAIPVIILTAHGSTALVVRAIKQGAYHFVLKPLDIEDIAVTIHQAIEHAHLQHKLAESKADLNRLIENIPDIVYSLDTQGQFIKLSPATLPVMGYKPAKLLGRSVFAVIHEHDRERIATAFFDAVKTRTGGTRRLEFRMVTKSGEVKHFEISSRLVVEDGRPVRFDGIARDITERKKLEEQLKKHSEKLEATVEERTKRLAYANRQLAALTKVSNRFTKIHDEDKLFDEVPKLITTSLDFDRATLYLMEDGYLKVRSACFAKDPPEMIERFIRVSKEGKIKWPPHFQESFAENKTIHIPDLNADPRWPKEGARLIRTKAIVISPIRIKGKPIGVIAGNMQHHERAMDKQDIARFEMFANMVGLAVDNIRAYQSLEQKVIAKTKSLQDKARQLEDSAIELGQANVDLLSVQEKLEDKNAEMGQLLVRLSQSRDQLQAILDSSLTAILMVDRQGKILATNRRITDYFNLAPERVLNRPFDQVNARIRKIVAEPEKFDSLVDYLQNHPDDSSCAEPELDFHHERAIELKGSPSRFVTVFVVPVLDTENHELGRVWVYADITRLKQADEQLHLLVEASPIPSIITRLHDGKIIYANDRLGELVGTTKEKLIGRVSPDFYYDVEVRQQVIGILQRDGILPHMEVRLKKIDGTPIWTIFSLALTELGGEQVILGGIYDITERKEAQEKLAEAQALLSAAIEQSPSGIVVADAPEGRIRIANASALAIRGQTPARLIDIEVSDHSVRWQTFYPDGTPFESEDLPLPRAILHGEVSKDVEMIIRRESGEDRWVSATAAPIRDQSGTITAGIALFNDITERKQAEDALRQAHDDLAVRLRYEEALADCSRTLLMVPDSSEALNGAIAFLYTASRASRVYIFENFEDETDGLCMRQTHEVCAKGITPQIDNELLQHAPYKMGFQRWRSELSQGRPINDLVENFPESEQAVLIEQGILSMLVLPIMMEKKWFGFIGFDDCQSKREWSEEDIRSLRTAAEMIGIYIENRRVAEALRYSEERFRSLVENANDVIYSFTPEGKLSYLSPQFTALMGYDPGEYIGRDFHSLIHPDDLDLAVRAFEQGLREGNRDIGTEYRLQHKDGGWRWIEDHSSVVRDENGEVTEFIGIAYDITEMKKALDDLAAANQELRDTQAQLVQSEKMASLGMLVAGIAHEINTPVGAINSMHNTLVRAVAKLKDSLAEQCAGESAEGGRLNSFLRAIEDANKVIESATERVTTMVRRLRSFARLDEAELKTIDIHEGLEDTLLLIHHEIKHNIEVKRNFGDIPDIPAYAGRLNQVFLNIFNNARQAIMGKGEITITTFQRDGKVHIAIADSGVGIPSEKLKKVFDPGFTTKGVGVGTGLGLSICYQIIQDHKGEIKVESEPGKGTTFTIILPTNLDQLVETG